VTALPLRPLRESLARRNSGAKSAPFGHKRAKLGIEPEVPKDLRIPKRFEHRTDQLVLQVGLAREAIAESQPDGMPA